MRVTGLPSSWSGFASVIPLIPLCAVPNQYASTVSLSTPAASNACALASMIRSSRPASNRSPNAVHPIPTIATLSLIPCEPMAVSALSRP